MQTRAFYVAALAVLRYVEHQVPTGRRFGEDADARWKSFHGHLTRADRIDLLLRDADVEFPGAFGPRTAFTLRGVAEDEPIGAEWTSLDPQTAETIWRQLVRDVAPAADVGAVLGGMARAWELTLSPVKLPAITPTTRLVVVGPSAIAASIEVFASRKDLAWGDQVVCVASPPGHRQLAASAAAILRSTKPTQLYAASSQPPLQGGHVLVESVDADPTDLAAARAVRS